MGKKRIWVSDTFAREAEELRRDIERRINKRVSIADALDIEKGILRKKHRDSDFFHI